MGSYSSKQEDKSVSAIKSSDVKQTPITSIPLVPQTGVSRAACALRGDIVINKITSVIPGFT
jgi:hypothetical protein